MGRGAQSGGRYEGFADAIALKWCNGNRAANARRATDCMRGEKENAIRRSGSRY
jgi:hypothetical protein